MIAALFISRWPTCCLVSAPAIDKLTSVNRYRSTQTVVMESNNNIIIIFILITIRSTGCNSSIGGSSVLNE